MSSSEEKLQKLSDTLRELEKKVEIYEQSCVHSSSYIPVIHTAPDPVSQDVYFQENFNYSPSPCACDEYGYPIPWENPSVYDEPQYNFWDDQNTVYNSYCEPQNYSWVDSDIVNNSYPQEWSIPPPHYANDTCYPTSSYYNHVETQVDNSSFTLHPQVPQLPLPYQEISPSIEELCNNLREKLEWILKDTKESEMAKDDNFRHKLEEESELNSKNIFDNQVGEFEVEENNKEETSFELENDDTMSEPNVIIDCLPIDPKFGDDVDVYSVVCKAEKIPRPLDHPLCHSYPFSFSCDETDSSGSYFLPLPLEVRLVNPDLNLPSSYFRFLRKFSPIVPFGKLHIRVGVG